jgi:hypothetical protein
LLRGRGPNQPGGRLIQLLNNFDRKIECFPEMFLARSSSESNENDARQSNAGASGPLRGDSARKHVMENRT